MVNWTDDQKKAIESTGGTILVSAAAGSGKTAVLVERVIRRICDREDPCSADSLLIVTFTKAATAQMKEKISAALDDKIKEDPANEYLQKQKLLLPFAHISTIDSFCGEIVRENFYELGISPDFKMLDDTELRLMQSDALSKVTEECYKSGGVGFDRLLKMFVRGSDDSALGDAVLEIYKNARAFPFADEWLDSLAEPYKDNSDAKNSVWGKILTDYLKDAAIYCYNLICEVLDNMKYDETVNEKYEPLFKNYEIFIEKLFSVIETGTWDDICAYVSLFEGGQLIPLPRGYESAIANKAKAVKSEISDIFKKKIPKYLCCNEAEFEDDREYLLPAVEKLIEMVKSFGKEFSSIKALANGADFNDVVDYALKLLIKGKDKNGEPIKTELAKEISLKFDEILVDEFQDINETQNLLFKAVSRNESNLFMVGDVKQSIYRFRQAMPDIFIERRKSLQDYIDGNYPAKINLDFNFRSRSGVTEFANFIFSQLMSEKAGEIDYTDEEALKAKADYKPHDDIDAEVHLITGLGEKADMIFEANYAAKYIKELIESGYLVKESDSERPVTYRDLCILLRSTKNKADIYADALTNAGIPCYVSNRSGFFASTEIRTVLSLMRVIDNPLQDVPLLTSLISPIFGFSPDELSKMRINYPKGPFYNCVYQSAENGNQKCTLFLNNMRKLRTLCAALGAGEFLRELYDYTGYDALVSAMPGGSQRRANLSMLLDYAEKYEQSGHTGLSGFIRFIDRVEKQKGDFEIANEISESADVVRIMSIHKSKGLEFPVCILADCSGKFNDDYLKSSSLLHPKYGIAFKRNDGIRRFDTLQQKAIQTACERASRSEELRVMYVALTRAKEKTVCLIRENNPQKKIEKLVGALTGSVKINPFKVISCKSMGDWLLLASIRNPDAASISDFYNEFEPLKTDTRINFVAEFGGDVVLSEKKEKTVKPLPDEELLALLSNRIAYRYPYGYLSGIPSKISPSELDRNEDDMKYFASSKPKFLSKNSVAANVKGSVTHKFLQFYDYKSKAPVKEQIDKMTSLNILTAEEAEYINLSQIERFIKSELAGRISKSNNLLREKMLTVAIPCSQIYKDIPLENEEKILVQGYIDCAFEEDGEWVIVDYKTDRADDENILKRRYYGQLKMYEKALFECTGKRVKETLIYSLYLSKQIKL